MAQVFLGKNKRPLKQRPKDNYKAGSNWYANIHIWVKSTYGKPSHCTNKNCPGGAKRYEWSNISGEYLRDIEDWQQLCAKCHRAMDTQKPFCTKGHAMTGNNRRVVSTSGHTYCGECRRIRAIENYYANRILKKKKL